MPTPVTAVYDACVLYPAPLRDLLVRLAIAGLVRGRWTDRIQDEWTRNLIANRPDLRPESLRRTRRLMDEHVREGLVTGYESLIAGLQLPDPDDRHVLAAAIHARADVIVTYNLSDFPLEPLARVGVRSEDPDRFIAELVDQDASAVCAVLRSQRHDLQRQPTVEQMLATFAQQRLPRTVEHLRPLAHLL